MRVTIPDEVLDPYLAMADRTGRTIEATVTEQLDRWAAVPPEAVVIPLIGQGLERAQQATGGLPFRDAEDAVTRIESLASITFHNIHLDFSQQQLKELEHRAERQGKTVAQLAGEMIAQITTEFFWSVPPGPAAEPVPAPEGRPLVEVLKDDDPDADPRPVL